MKTNIIDEPYLTSEEACALLRISPCTLYRYTKNGEIPVVRIGGLLRFKRRSIMDHIEGSATGLKRNENGEMTKT